MKEIIVALATPFDDNNKINFSILDAIVEHNLKQGADGFFVGGSAGEGMLLTLDEKVELIEYLSKYRQTVKLIANVSALGELESTFLAKNILITYGKESIKRIGLYDEVKTILEKNNKNIFELPGIKPNPDLTNVYDGIAICKTNDVDLRYKTKP